MRILYILTVLLLMAVASKAQLKNTKWQGTMNVPDETPVMLDFKNDSVDILVVENGMVAESMSYLAQDSIITMKKTSGHSPCNVDDVFKVKYLIKDDKLFISTISDPCDERAASWTKEPFTRVKK